MSHDGDLVKACIKGDLAEVERLVAEDETLFLGRPTWAHTLCPINSAASRGNAKVVRLLVEKVGLLSSVVRWLDQSIL